MDAWTARRAEAADLDDLVAHNLALARETEGLALDPGAARRGVSFLLGHPEHGFYLVAGRGGTTAGSLGVTAEWSDWRNGFFWWMQSVYVRPAFRRQGVCRALFAGLARLVEARDDVTGFRLYVHRANEGARAAYRALGMAETAYRLYEAENPLPTAKGPPYTPSVRTDPNEEGP